MTKYKIETKKKTYFDFDLGKKITTNTYSVFSQINKYSEFTMAIYFTITLSLAIIAIFKTSFSPIIRWICILFALFITVIASLGPIFGQETEYEFTHTFDKKYKAEEYIKYLRCKK